MIKDILNEIKWAYQRVRRGYDDTIYWGLEDYLRQIIPAIEEFCLRNLKEKELMKLNPKRKEIFGKTIKLIKDFRRMPYKDNFKRPNQISKLWSYVGENIMWFWD